MHLLLIVENNQQRIINFQFPICITPKAFKSACDRGQIKGVGANAKRLIESVQPFKTATPDDTVLYVVSQYDNADKHRLLVVLTAVAHLGANITIGGSKGIEEVSGKIPNIVGFGDMGVKKLTNEGVNVFSIKLAEPVPDFTADATPDFQLAFDQCGRVNCAPLISTLQNILEGVRNTIDSFENEFNGLTT